VSSSSFALGWAVLDSDPARATELFEESIRHTTSFTGNPTSRAARLLLAQAELRLGRVFKAQQSLALAVAQNREAGDLPSIVAALDVASECLLELGKVETAARLAAFVGGPGASINLAHSTVRDPETLRAELAARLGLARFTELFSAGQSLSFDEAAQLALESLDDPDSA
jgi:hypothetical protein